jgi:predicted DNA-binding transcriptional regulator AlpA
VFIELRGNHMQPDERASRILSMADLIRLGWGESPATIWRRVKQGIIPPPFELGNEIGFWEREIVAAERTRPRRTPGAKLEQTAEANT